VSPSRDVSRLMATRSFTHWENFRSLISGNSISPGTETLLRQFSVSHDEPGQQFANIVCSDII